MTADALVLVLNCGSSSVKLAVVEPGSGRRHATGLAERVGTPGVVVHLEIDGEKVEPAPDDPSPSAVIAAMVAALPSGQLDAVTCAGHRVVHGGPRFEESVLLDDTVLDEIRALVPMAPLHNPAAIAGIEAISRVLPHLPQVAAFDTGFHQTLPPVAFHYAVPREWYEQHHVRRYGFHGISYRFVSARAAQLLGRPLEELRLVVLHLGNGCSAAAISGGRSVDTTMGLTPMEGLVMGTRSGDVDPGLIGYAVDGMGMDAGAALDALRTHSGLLGLSGTSNDMRTVVEAADAGDERAALAVDVFCYRAAKAVGAYAVALGGLDAVVFTGGIGEHAAPARRRILDRLELFGVRVDAAANGAHGATTSGRISEPGDVLALVVPTDEEVVVARDAARITASGDPS